MQRRRWLVCLLVIYIALDLSLAIMPGAFVFNPTDCVESIQMSRARHVASGAMAPARVPPLMVISTRQVAVCLPVLRGPRTPGGRLRMPYRPPASLDQPPPASEDSD